MFSSRKTPDPRQEAFDKMHELLGLGGEAARAVGSFFNIHAVAIDELGPLRKIGNDKLIAADVEIASKEASAQIEQALMDKRENEKATGFIGLTGHSKDMIKATSELDAMYVLMSETLARARDALPTEATFSEKLKEGWLPKAAMHEAYSQWFKNSPPDSAIEGTRRLKLVETIYQGVELLQHHTPVVKELVKQATILASAPKQAAKENRAK